MDFYVQKSYFLMSEISKLLENIWSSSNIKPGDHILLHSNLTRLFRSFYKNSLKITSSDILDSLINFIGAHGTLVLPTFNFQFPSTQRFDINNTKSEMGVLTEIARSNSNFIRSGHPIYSFATIGYLKEEFDIMNKSGYGKDSPFGVIHKYNGKIVIINLPENNSMTFYHYVEEYKNVKYRYHKNFHGKYTDINNITSDRTFTLFVRDLDQGVITNVEPMGRLLWKKGLYCGEPYGVGNSIRSIDSKVLFDETCKIIDKNLANKYLYNIEKNEI